MSPGRFSGLVDPNARVPSTFLAARATGSLSSVERQLFSIHCKKVLAKKYTEVLKDVAKSTDDRIVFPDGLFALGNVQNVKHND